jgi:hypothetical protein
MIVVKLTARKDGPPIPSLVIEWYGFMPHAVNSGLKDRVYPLYVNEISK